MGPGLMLVGRKGMVWRGLWSVRAWVCFEKFSLLTAVTNQCANSDIEDNLHNFDRLLYRVLAFYLLHV